jgi:polar amino acid transport system substrate-binding protein
VDGEYARIAGLARRYEALIRVPERLSDFEFVVFARTPVPHVTTWSDLAALHVAYIEGWRFLEDSVTHYASLTLVPDEDLLFGLLSVDRVDAVIYERRRGDAYLERNDLEGVRALDPPLAVRPMYLYLNRRNAALVEPLSEALRAMSRDGTVAEIEAAAFGASEGRP